VSVVNPYYAHTAPQAGSDWQLLEDHLRGVAERASNFSESFEAPEWGRLAGLWHDIGKYSSAFQDYLRSATEPDVHLSDQGKRTDHSTAGAQLAVRAFGGLGHLLAFPIAGHHSGLLDAIAPGASLDHRLEKAVEPWEQNAIPTLLQATLPPLPPRLSEALATKDGFSIAFFVRMVFSCLVDADFLDTGAFMDPARESRRFRWPDDVLARMERALGQHLEDFGAPSTGVDRRRAEVLSACLAAADRDPGLFTLTVPTGGGKTLSSLAFALRHARIHGQRRIVYVAPFTSIIEQNADVFREALRQAPLDGVPDPIIEHHSSLDPEGETDGSRRAAENWDAPLVVTTAVQFYESLFANRTSRCRKLHNLAKSVIVLDEAQCLPVDFLSPCLRALKELSAGYGATVVLCTATQPAVGRRSDFPVGLRLTDEREIVPDPGALFDSLRRVQVKRCGVLADVELGERLEQLDQVLCIVNTRKHARRLFELLEDARDVIHLSASMCPAHRSARIKDAKARLERTERCRVVATQVVEAGVDIDFPVVYRALAGVDAIAQAAGRCNRNGRLDLGTTFVFESEHPASERFLADTAGSARQVLSIHDDPLSLEAVKHYFRLYYWEQSHRWDRRGIIDAFRLGRSEKLPFLFNFSTAARDFRIIEQRGVPVFVPWSTEGASLCEELRRGWPGPTRKLLRRLQRYAVEVPRRTLLDEPTAFEVVHEQYPVLAFPEQHYSEDVGVTLGAAIDDQLVF